MRKKRFFSCFLTIVLIAVMTFTPNPVTSFAAADTEAPVIDIDSLNVSQTSAEPGDTITISVKVTDNVKVSNVYVAYITPQTNKREVVSLKYDISKDIYSASLSITDVSECGSWKIYYISAYDSSDNYTYIYGSSTDLSKGCFTVSGTNADVTKPIIDIDSLSVSQSNAEPGDTVTISVRVTDNVKVSNVYVAYITPQTNKREVVSLKYDISKDIYSASLSITDVSECGSWKIYYISAYDSSDNYTYIYGSSTDLSKGCFTVSHSGDSQQESVCDFEVALGNTLSLSYEANCDINWTLSDSSIAKITNVSSSTISMGSYKRVVSSCTLVPIKEGIVTVYAVDNDGYMLNSAKVKVTKAEVTEPDTATCASTLIVDKDTALSNQTITGDVYISKDVTLTLNGTNQISGNVYVFGTLKNNGSLNVSGTINCLKYNSMMSAGDYNYGYFINTGSLNVKTLNVKDDYLDYKVSHNFGDWEIVTSPTTESTGIKERICTDCGFKETQTISKIEIQNELGDINSDKSINSSDALLALKHSVGKIKLTDTQLTAGDVTKDGKINSSDALRILQYSVGLISEF